MTSDLPSPSLSLLHLSVRVERSGKNYRLHQSKIDRAKKVLGTKSETETIELALDLVVFGEQLLAGVDRMRGQKLLYPDEWK